MNRRASLLTSLLLLASTPLAAVDSVTDTTLPLLFRPGLPKGHGSVWLFYDQTMPANAQPAAFADQEYSQRDHGALVIVNAIRGDDWIGRAYLGSRIRDLDGDLTFASGLELPSRIEQVAFGTSGKRQFGRQGALTWRLGLNSTSDDTFHSSDEISVEGEVLYMGYRENQDAWMTGIFYSSQGVYPVPTAAYIWRVNDQLMFNIGVPVVGFRWQPAERWEVNGHGAAIIDDASIEITRGFGESLPVGDQYSITAKLYRDNWTTRPVDRVDPDYVLSFKEWRLGLGGTIRFGFIGSLELESGYTFNRKLTEEEKPDVFDDGDYSSRIRIDDSWYLRAKVALNF